MEGVGFHRVGDARWMSREGTSAAVSHRAGRPGGNRLGDPGARSASDGYGVDSFSDTDGVNSSWTPPASTRPRRRRLRPGLDADGVNPS